ncbi:MAG: DUF342 domain-containing protein, partial [Planctomycetes bacterium]|nr:DUF342 domain-containing protein [Planctomycetota bacterium]
MATTANATSTNVSVEVSPDRMRAMLTFLDASKKKDAEDLSEEVVFDALSRDEIELTDAVKQRVTEFVELVGRGEEAKDFVVAEGRKPFNGKDEEFVWSEAFQKEADSWRDDAPVNYYENTSIITVEKGENVGTIAPIEPPRDGVDVTGRVIPAKGKPKTLALDPNAFEPLTEDSTQLITKMAGCPACEGGTLTIQEVLTVSGDVDFESGSIDASIGVHVNGRVLDRFTVRSKGSVTVCAAIEAARVDAEGDVTVKQGILGRNMGLVTAKGDIVAKFCSETHLFALGDIKIAKQLMASHICVGGKLIGTAAGLIGGCVFAGGGVEVATLGSEANVPTRVVIGVAPALVRELAVLQRSIQPIKDLADRIKNLLAKLKPAENSLTAEQAECMRELFAKAKAAEARLKTDQVRHDELVGKVYTDGEVSVVVGKVIYAGT